MVTIKLSAENDGWPLEDMANELEELCGSSGAEVVDNITCLRDKPTPNLFIGKGKTEEIALACQAEDVDMVIFSRDLSGTQKRNLEEAIGKKIIDRTQLILDIFALHAKSPEGKMQVELAQLQYLMPRLSGKGVTLSRLGGGIGTRGPGEQKLEVDRRRIRSRIDKLKEDLKHTKLHRLTMRKRRKDKAIPIVALVGYTNAGKSTLINTLTGSGQTVADSLFTTLDPLSRRLQLPNGENIIVFDTVGFLHDLPHHLVEAFKATLEEVVQADLLLHVLDASHAMAGKHAKAVLEVLKELGVDDKPIITALNKIDLVDDKAWIGRLKDDFVNPVPISAKFKLGLDILLAEVEKEFQAKTIFLQLLMPHSRMDIVDLFYRQGKVEKIEYLQKGIKIKGMLPKIVANNILKNKEIEQVN